MLRSNHLVGFGSGGGFGQTLMEAITAAGLTTNLQLCLDAGDPASWPGSGLKWLDRSGNGYDFFLGTDGTTAAPTHVGGAGNRQGYWLFNGSTYFTYDTTNETWMQNLHKNNAIFSVVAFYFQDGTNEVVTFLGGAGSPFTGTGLTAGIASSQRPSLAIKNAGANALAKTGDTSLAASSWHMAGFSLTEATGSGGGFLYSDGSYNQVSASDTFDSTYSSPSSGSASFAYQIGARGDADTPPSSGMRLSCVGVWGGTAITKANMDTLWAAMRPRFGI